jgi:hypothetical protein
LREEVPEPVLGTGLAKGDGTIARAIVRHDPLNDTQPCGERSPRHDGACQPPAATAQFAPAAGRDYTTRGRISITRHRQPERRLGFGYSAGPSIRQSRVVGRPRIIRLQLGRPITWLTPLHLGRTRPAG